MTEKVSMQEYVERSGLNDDEKKIIISYIESRDLSRKTEKERGYMFVNMALDLRERGSSFTLLTMDDIAALAKKIKKESKPNTRQTYTSNLKAIAKYIHRKHHKIEGLFEELPDIKAGTPQPGDKTVITDRKWLEILNAPGLTMRERVMLQHTYAGFHRPGELFILKWSDFKRDGEGRIYYTIVFKTEKPRQIALTRETTIMLDTWRRELGTVPDDSPVYPTRDGKHYLTNYPYPL